MNYNGVVIIMLKVGAVLVRVLVISDSHGATNKMIDLFNLHPEADAVIFLGDGERDLDLASEHLGTQPVYKVCGNCDFYSQLDTQGIVEIASVRVLYCHGHTYGVKSGYSAIKKAARKFGAGVVLFGHTHFPDTGFEDGLYFMNPGSLREGCYGMLDITEGGIATILCKL